MTTIIITRTLNPNLLIKDINNSNPIINCCCKNIQLIITIVIVHPKRLIMTLWGRLKATSLLTITIISLQVKITNKTTLWLWHKLKSSLIKLLIYSNPINLLIIMININSKEDPKANRNSKLSAYYDSL